MDYLEQKKKTEELIKNPKVGMRFHEMFSYWVYVIQILPGGGVITREFSGHPANPPADFIIYKTYNAYDFEKHVSGLLYCDSNALKCIKKEVYTTSKELGF